MNRVRNTSEETSSNTAPAPIPPTSSLAAEAADSSTVKREFSRAAEKYASFNFVVIALYQIVVRTGWIFKTESIVIPAVLDSIGGTGWLRGMLPPLNRFGQSIPPLLAARRIKVQPRKKQVIAFTTTIMGACFLLLAVLWLYSDAIGTWLKYIFLLVYGIFFVAVGLNSLALGTLTGKLVPARRRGRLMLVANIVGALTAVSCAWFLLRLWLKADDANFTLIFGFAGTAFLLAALVCGLLREPRDRYRDLSQPLRHIVADAIRAVRGDRDFAKLVFVAAAFGSSMVLFPHYQAMGREQLQLDFTELVLWVIVQNLGTGFFSIPAGLLADRLGNRIVLQLILLGLICGPLLALGLTSSAIPLALPIRQKLFACVFLLVGFTPIVIRILGNYSMELTRSENHPRYLSTLSLSMALPVMCFSPLAGWLVDKLGFRAVFLSIVGVLICGWLVVFSIREPRNDQEHGDAGLDELDTTLA
jgi:MFS family permease